jgi:pyrroloquinoline-quinone synthase
MLDRALDGLHLSTHPFYERWNAGDVSIAELRAYAAQYRHFERALPALLARAAARAESGAVREQAERNLADEAGHPALFERFARSVDAADEAPSEAMARLLAAYESASSAGAAQALAALWAYEAQAPVVARLKADALRAHYGLDGDAVAFWDVHAEMDVAHAAWGREAIEASGADDESVHACARAAAKAWWAFLDEREALAPALRAASQNASGNLAIR